MPPLWSPQLCPLIARTLNPHGRRDPIAPHLYLAGDGGANAIDVGDDGKKDQFLHLQALLM